VKDNLADTCILAQFFLVCVDRIAHFVKPLDVDMLESLSKRHWTFFLLLYQYTALSSRTEDGH